MFHAIFGAVFLVNGLAGDRSDAKRDGLLLMGLVMLCAAYREFPRSRPPVTRDGALVFAASQRSRVAERVTLLVAAVGFALTVSAPWGVLVGAGLLGLLAVTDRRLVREVALDPEAVTVRTPQGTIRAPWNHRAVTMPKPGSLHIDDHSLRTTLLDCDPEVLYWTLRHYAEQPGDRAELGTTVAEARVEREDLADEDPATNALATGW